MDKLPFVTRIHGTIPALENWLDLRGRPYYIATSFRYGDPGDRSLPTGVRHHDVMLDHAGEAVALAIRFGGHSAEAPYVR
jgi:hypothetical protein